MLLNDRNQLNNKKENETSVLTPKCIFKKKGSMNEVISHKSTPEKTRNITKLYLSLVKKRMYV